MGCPARLDQTPRPRRHTWPGKRRQLRRHSFIANVSASPLDGRHNAAHGVTSDLSVEGAFIHAVAPPPEDSLVLVKIYSLHGTFDGLARVCHESTGVGFGCQFLDLDDQQYIGLCRLIASRESSGRHTLPY
jgi:hypothetical protein